MGTRRVGRAEDRGAGLGDRPARGLGQDRKAQHIRGLALVGRHAEGGVALEVLDRAEALPVGLAHVLHGDVVLEIHPGAAAALRDVPEGTMRAGSSSARGASPAGHAWPHPSAAARPASKPLLSAAPSVSAPWAAPATFTPGGQVRAGHEGRDVLAPDGPAAVVAGEVDVGRPAARDGEAVGLDAAPVAERDRAERVAPTGAGDDLAAAGIEHADDLDALRPKVLCRPEPVVVVGEDRHPAPRCHAEAVDVGAHGTREHHAGAVVVGKRDGPFDGARGEDGAPGVDAPVHLAGLATVSRQVVRAPLQRAVDTVVEDAVDGGARHQADVGHRGELGRGRLGPVGARAALDGVGLGQEPARPSGSPRRRGSPGRPRARRRARRRGPRARRRSRARRSGGIRGRRRRDPARRKGGRAPRRPGSQARRAAPRSREAT